MTLPRRRFVAAGAAGVAALAVPTWIGRAAAAPSAAALPVPPVIEAATGGVALLEAIAGSARFVGDRATPVRGFNQPFLGPVLRVRRGTTARVDVVNRLGEPVSAHWHGLHVPGPMDGGPHQAIAPGSRWRAVLEIDQPAATLWYHSHVHGRTGAHVMAGLAGLLIVDDPDAAASGLPDAWGADDLPLIIQDRRFDAAGRFVGTGGRGMGGMMGAMTGFRGDRMLVNGAVEPIARVPPGVVRLRLLNACNARTLHLHFDDGRPLHVVGSDGGLWPHPVATPRLTLGGGERCEALVDFGTGEPARLLSLPDGNGPMGGMGGMGGMAMMGGLEPRAVAPGGAFEVLRFEVDRAATAALRAVPERVGGAPEAPTLAEPVRRRRFVLDTHGAMGGGGMGGMGRGGMGGMGAMAMTINGRPYDHHRIDARARRGETELWSVAARDMAHPFHVHGGSFRVVSRNGRTVPWERSGWKDTVLVDGEVELLLRFAHPAGDDAPYMFHCHILDHEDAGMMGQFTVA